MLHCTTKALDLRDLLATAALALTLAACGGEARQCLTDGECASGVCLEDGRCQSATDGGPGADAAAGSDGGPSCQPDHDGVISRSEILLAAGRSATFRVALDATIDTTGTLGAGGDRQWDFGDLAGETDVLTELTPLAGAWYADVFPGATYATRLSQTEDLLGVFEINDTALLLRGIVSPEAGLGRTELTYDPPLVLLELPLATTSSWSTTSTVSGLASGVGSIYTEEVASQVDAIGTLQTPFGPFPVHRVRGELTRTVGVVVVTLRSFSFVAECFGIVGQVSSQQFESEVEFSEATEVSRLSL